MWERASCHESRFSIGEHDYFFQYLLETVLDIPNLLELHTDANQEHRWFDLLLFLFPYYLKVAMRKGVFKTYLRNQYNDEKVKGTIDLTRHIKENTPFTGKIAYNQREFSYDNYIMELIRHTIEFIKKKPYGINLLKKVTNEVRSVVGATTNYEYYDRRKIIVENKNNPLRHAYYREYRILQRLCIMILQHEKHQIGSGLHQIHGILVDGAWLWEEYVNLLIGKEFYHPKNKVGKGGERLFDRNRGLIYPDFISCNADNRTIADAKYKPCRNINGGDYQQLLAYMFRFDAKKGFYLYPQSYASDTTLLKLNRGSTYEKNVAPREDIFIFKLGLSIPNDACDYADFKEKMGTSEVRFRESVFGG